MTGTFLRLSYVPLNTSQRVTRTDAFANWLVPEKALFSAFGPSSFHGR
jgi:hypothetical protein